MLRAPGENSGPAAKRRGAVVFLLEKRLLPCRRQSGAANTRKGGKIKLPHAEEETRGFKISGIPCGKLASVNWPGKAHR